MMRELLFGDVPLAQWAGTAKESPWKDFQAATRAIERGDTALAEQSLRAVLAHTGLESRHYLQAWDALRGLGVAPAAEAKHLYGVVLDVPVQDGLDTLAGYEDGTARYLNYSGKIIVWESADEQISTLITDLHQAAHQILIHAGPWDGPRPPLPPGQSRVSLLTPSGIHFGQAHLDDLMQDRFAAPVFHTGVLLMQALMRRVPA
jgi:hypothetical protein